MLVIPTGTDAPIYHWPYATVGLIALNIVLFFFVPPPSHRISLDEDDEAVAAAKPETLFEQYALRLSDGRLHPLQWVTHNFLHYGFLHLAGNMLFLWAFGIVVEGKLGVIKYVLTYLAIGALHGALVQSILLRSSLDTNAAGASAVVYGLLTTCMIWAPRNELNCTAILMVGFRVLVFHWDLYYTTVALFYIGTQAFGLIFWGAVGGTVMLSELGHLSGAFWGTVVAIVLLKAGLVDCENWDVFSLWAKRKGLARDWKRREEFLDRQKEASAPVRRQRNTGWSHAADAEDGDATGPGTQERAAVALRRVRRLIDEADYETAVDVFVRASKSQPRWPEQAELYTLIKAMHARGAEVESIPLLRVHCRHYPQGSLKVRLKLAQILLRNCQRPLAALRVLEEISPGALTGDMEKARAKLWKQAEQMREEGVVEIEEDE